MNTQSKNSQVRESWNVLYIIKTSAAGRCIFTRQQRTQKNRNKRPDRVWVCKASGVNLSHILQMEADLSINLSIKTRWAHSCEIPKGNQSQVQIWKIKQYFSKRMHFVLTRDKPSINGKTLFIAINLLKIFFKLVIISSLQWTPDSISLNKYNYFLTTR